MKAFGLAVELLSPTMLAAAPPASNLIETLPGVPGNALRGALARAYLERGGDALGEPFRRLFLSGEVRFGCACLDDGEVMPLSARSCKYMPGFRAEGQHGVVDQLLGAVAADEADETRCPWPGCGKRLDSCGGLWSPVHGRRLRVRTRLVTRTAIDSARGTAKTSQLFSQRLLVEGQHFAAACEAPADLAAALAELVGDRLEVVLGAGGSRGQGWAELRITVAPASRGWGDAAARQAEFRQRAGRPVLVVTLLSDGLFRDDYLREATAPRPEDLVPLGIRPDDWRPVPERAFMDVRRVFGFDGLPVRLPREPRLAVAAGSVYCFAAKPGCETALAPGLGEGWIGDGSGEGFGRAVLWHPFHLGPEGAE